MDTIFVERTARASAYFDATHIAKGAGYIVPCLVSPGVRLNLEADANRWGVPLDSLTDSLLFLARRMFEQTRNADNQGSRQVAFIFMGLYLRATVDDGPRVVVTLNGES